jgi:hydrogenase maturation protease
VAASILTIGNRDRGDDGVGPYVHAGLSGRVPRKALLASDGNLTALLDIFERHAELILVDAAEAGSSGRAPGEVIRMNVEDAGLDTTALRASTHAIGICEAIALARALAILPRDLRIIAIAGDNFAPGSGLSASVARSADALIEELAGLAVPAGDRADGAVTASDRTGPQ